MSTKATDKPKRESVPTMELAESSGSSELAGNSGSSESIIKPSDKFLQIFESTRAFCQDRKKFSKKQIKIMQSKMRELYHEIITSKNTNLDDNIALAYAYVNVCFGYLQSEREEDLFTSESFALYCLHLIKDIELDPRIILITMKAYSHLSYICAHRSPQDGIQKYEEALELYLAYMEKDDCSSPIDCEDIITKPPTPTNGYEKLDNLYAFLLGALEQLYLCERPINYHSFMLTTHLSLTRELNKLKKTKKYSQWIEKTTTLCDDLILYSRFKEASNHIATAMYVEKLHFLDYLKKKQKYSSTEESRLYEKYFTGVQIINLCHLKYNVALLRRSTERLLRLEKDEDSEAKHSSTGYPSESKKQASQRLLLFAKTEKMYSDVSFPVQIKYIVNYDGAHKMFAQILIMLYDSGLQFDLNKNIKAYIQSALSISKAYRYMALYEKDRTSRLSLQNERVEILLDAVNLTRENSESKYLDFQLAIAYSTLLDSKVEELGTTYLPYTSHRADKIAVEMNMLLAKSLLSLQKYLQKAPIQVPE